MLETMTVLTPSRPARRSTPTPSRRALFVVSRDVPARYNSLAYAFDGDRDVRVIFDRRRSERRQQTRAPQIERRQENRRSDDRDWTLRTAGWVQIDPD